ncbi:unnamed protein product, partial [marine sediment metagenome]
MKYTIKHKTTYQYSAAVHQSYHLLHLSPCTVAHQRILRHRITTLPKADLQHDLTDFFGNPYAILTIEQDHSELIVEANSEIETKAVTPRDLSRTSDWGSLAQRASGSNLVMPKEVIQFALAS